MPQGVNSQISPTESTSAIKTAFAGATELAKAVSSSKQHATLEVGSVKATIGFPQGTFRHKILKIIDENFGRTIFIILILLLLIFWLGNYFSWKYKFDITWEEVFSIIENGKKIKNAI